MATFMKQAPTLDMQQCIDDCHNCASACQSGLRHCFMQMQGKDQLLMMSKSNVLMLMMDCIDLCACSIRLLQRQSPELMKVCPLCADMTRRCAAACRQMEDSEMEVVAEACDAAAISCERLTSGRREADGRRTQRPVETSL